MDFKNPELQREMQMDYVMVYDKAGQCATVARDEGQWTGIHSIRRNMNFPARAVKLMSDIFLFYLVSPRYIPYFFVVHFNFKVLQFRFSYL